MFLDGPYSLIAGRDGSRSLATFSMHESAIKDEYDDLSDLNSMQVTILYSDIFCDILLFLYECLHRAFAKIIVKFTNFSNFWLKWHGA